MLAALVSKDRLRARLSNRLALIFQSSVRSANPRIDSDRPGVRDTRSAKSKSSSIRSKDSSFRNLEDERGVCWNIDVFVAKDDRQPSSNVLPRLEDRMLGAGPSCGTRGC